MSHPGLLRRGLACVLAIPAASPAEDALLPGVSPRAMAIHSAALLFDGHNDLPWNLRAEGALGSPGYDLRRRLDHDHTDIPRLRAGGVKAQFWSVYVPAILARRGGAARATLEQIDLVHRMIALYPEAFELALTAGDVERIARAGKIASVIGIEGGHSIEGSLGTLRMMHRLLPKPLRRKGIGVFAGGPSRWYPGCSGSRGRRFTVIDNSFEASHGTGTDGDRGELSRAHDRVRARDRTGHGP